MALICAVVSLYSCSDMKSELEVTEDVVFGLRVDEIQIDKAYIRFTHDGSQDDFWSYLVTEDMTTDGAELLNKQLSEELDGTEKIVANVGVNKSIRIEDLEAKTSYRVVASRISEAGDLVGNLAELTFTTLRDPDVFEKHPDWTIVYKERVGSEGNPNLKLEVFSCIVDGEESTDTYVPVVISKDDFVKDCGSSIRTCFESYVYYLDNTENVHWPDEVTSASTEFSQDRLRHGDYMLFMVGVDTLGTLTGYYAQTEYNLAQEEMTDEYKKWLGDWVILGKSMEETEIRYDVKIEADENNLFYRMSGWESTTAADYFIDPVALPTQLPIQLYFEGEKVYFVSEALKEVSDFNISEMYDFYFYGCVMMGESLMPIDIPNLKIASLKFTDDSHAAITPEIFKFEMDGFQYELTFVLFEYSYKSMLYDGLVPVTYDSMVPLIETMEFIKMEN